MYGHVHQLNCSSQGYKQENNELRHSCVYVYSHIYSYIHIYTYIYMICAHVTIHPGRTSRGKHRQENPKRHVLNKKVTCFNYT